MAAEGGATGVAIESGDLARQLAEQPYVFEFFQAVRLVEKFGGDSVSETKRNLDSYLAAIPENLATVIDA